MPTARTDKKSKTAEPAAPPVVTKETKADKIWNQIKDLPVEMYALPNQTVSQHVERLKVTEDQVHLRVRSPAIVPALEEAVSKLKLGPGESFHISPQKNFTVVSVVVDSDALVK